MTTEAPAPPPAAPPASPTHAQRSCDAMTALKADPAWNEGLMRGGPEQTRTFHSLHELISKGDDVDVAISGVLPSMPNSDLREMAGHSGHAPLHGVHGSHDTRDSFWERSIADRRQPREEMEGRYFSNAEI